jgi:carbon monoxide dehydrogenase subunit G
MAEAEYTTTARLPVETIWEFVREMDHWAPMVTGYQSHVKESENDSVWTLKGDVGVLARVVRFRVHVSEWAGPSRVRFSLEGLNEPMKGEGLFEMAPIGAAGAAAADAPPAARLPFWRRWAIALTRFLSGLPVALTRFLSGLPVALTRFLSGLPVALTRFLSGLPVALTRFLFRLRHGRVERAALPGGSAGPEGARLTFRLRVEPGGPMAPLVNAMMQPAMVPFAENLADRIMAHLEKEHGLRA